VIFGAPRRHFARCDSTNDQARELAAAGAPSGTVVTADEQSAGRGRQGRTWTAPRGKALLYSAILRPLTERHLVLPLAVPLAVAEAAESAAPVECRLKWPNDVWIEGRKCAGVLVEARPRDGWAVVGVGLNLSIEADEFPPELRETATSLGHGVSTGAALRSLNERLGEWADADPSRVIAAFRDRDGLQGERIAWEDGEGVADGIDDRGNLLVVTGSGQRLSLGAGEVHLSTRPE
jgi:BirA family biotin operon repressor/biotin-[acetyl-CoA-carboxylase] ligase